MSEVQNNTDITKEPKGIKSLTPGQFKARSTGGEKPTDRSAGSKIFINGNRKPLLWAQVKRNPALFIKMYPNVNWAAHFENISKAKLKLIQETDQKAIQAITL